jgi:hypothetical protein
MGTFSSNYQLAKAKKKSHVQQGGHPKNAHGLVKAARHVIMEAQLSNQHHNDNASDTETNEQVEVALKLTMKEREAMGFLVVTQEEMQIAVKVWYIYEFHEPDEND